MQPLTFAQSTPQQVAIILQNNTPQLGSHMFSSPQVKLVSTSPSIQAPQPANVVVHQVQPPPPLIGGHYQSHNSAASFRFNVATPNDVRSTCPQRAVPNLHLLQVPTQPPSPSSVSSSSCSPSSPCSPCNPFQPTLSLAPVSGSGMARPKRDLSEKPCPPSKRVKTSAANDCSIEGFPVGGSHGDLSDAEILARKSKITLEDLLSVNLAKPVVQRSQYVHVNDNKEKQRRRKEQNNKSAARARSYMKSVSELVHVFQEALRQQHRQNLEMAETIQKKDAELAQLREQLSGR